MPKKKILFVLPWLSVGGLERVQVSIANALAARGHDVTVMTLQVGDDLRNQLSENIRFIQKQPKPFSVMRRIPYIRHKFYDDGVWETRATPRQLYAYYIGNEKYDVEIGFFRGLSIKIISGSYNRDAIKIAWVHSDFLKCGGIQNNFKNFELVKRAYKSFDAIVCVSEQAKESFIKKTGIQDKVKVIYNLLPINEILLKKETKCGIEKNRFTILSVGHLVDIKGYDRLLTVVRRLNDAGYIFELWLVGDGDQKEKLQGYIKENKLTNVRLLGKQLNPYAYMSCADLYVCASRFEGYNLTVAEALICGLPVISTDCTGPTEILGNGDYGLLVNNSEEGLYTGIKLMLDNPVLLEKYKFKAKERLRFFDEERIVGQIEELFEEKRNQ